MEEFAQIIGQEHIKEHFKGAILSKMSSHAYILQGEKGTGKMSLAELFARGLNCERGEAEPCNECHSCRQAMTYNHPDIKVVTHEKPNLISVQEIRTQVVNDVEIKPYSSPYKIYIIPEAEKMNPAAQNALLKTLEEPPAYVVILLLTSNAELLLDTIRSRCVILTVRPLQDNQVRDFLMRHYQVPDYQADLCVAFARGNIGRAKNLVNNEDFENLKSTAAHLLKNIKSLDVSDLQQQVKQITELNASTDDFLDYLFMWYRDVLLFKATGNTDRLLFKDDVRIIKERASECSYEGIEAVIEEIDTVRNRLKANVNKELTLELLLLKIKEN